MRVIVFGQENLSNSFSVDSSGAIAMPLIGQVRAQGLTTSELAGAIEARLGQGYVREPRVSVEVEAFRPFFVMGEVNVAGQYPFINGMTVQNAIAVAGGFTPRAVQDSVDITRIVGGSPGDLLRAPCLPGAAGRHDNRAGTVLLDYRPMQSSVATLRAMGPCRLPVKDLPAN